MTEKPRISFELMRVLFTKRKQTRRVYVCNCANKNGVRPRGCYLHLNSQRQSIIFILKIWYQLYKEKKERYLNQSYDKIHHANRKFEKRLTTQRACKSPCRPLFLAIRRRSSKDLFRLCFLLERPLRRTPRAKRHQNLRFHTDCGRLYTVIWSNNSHPTFVFQPVYD